MVCNEDSEAKFFEPEREHSDGEALLQPETMKLEASHRESTCLQSKELEE